MSAEPTVQDRQRRIAREIADERRTALDELGREAIGWLAVVPSWTRPLARACDFPSPDLDQFIEAAQAAGLCRISRATRADEWQELRLLVALVPHLSPELVAESPRPRAGNQRPGRPGRRPGRPRAAPRP